MSRAPSTRLQTPSKTTPMTIDDSAPPPGYSEQIPIPPILTSTEAGWSSVGFEYYEHIVAGETPKLCFDHYAIAVTLGQGFQLDWQIEEFARGRVQRQMLFHGGMTLMPVKYVNWGAWNQPLQGFNLSLKPALLTRNATELLGVDRVEIPPRKPFYDPLILQIGLALKADLESQRPGGRLYAETMANALAVHILRNYSATHKPVHYLGGLSPTQLKLVTDYINDHLAQELSLEELAAIAQLSPYHFCRSFKRSTGFTPHQYVIRQRVERAKLLLKDGKMGISEVAFVCGFTHQSHLNRHFKRLTGVTPKFFSKS